MPYHHALAMGLSVLWWGVYFGCLGASIGALLGLAAEGRKAPAPRELEDAGALPMEPDLLFFPAADSDAVFSANRPQHDQPAGT
jgi:hypothetical protein